jgi:hypothetical protein
MPVLTEVSRKIAEFKQMCREYRELWRAGKVGSPEMKALLVRLRDWLKTEGLFSLDDPVLVSTFEHPWIERVTAQLPELDYDLEFQGLIGAILGVRDRSLEAN